MNWILFSAFIQAQVFTIQSWDRPLGGLPQPTSLPQTIKFRLTAPDAPGTVRFDQKQVRLDGEEVTVRLYHVYPRADQGLPQYYNLEISSLRMFCAMTPSAEKKQVPPLVCGVSNEHGTRGVTLKQRY